MTTQEISTVSPTSHTSFPFYAPHIISTSIERFLGLLGVRLALLALFAFADVVFIKKSVDVVLQESEGISWFVAIIMTCLSVYTMLKSGYFYRTAAGTQTARWTLVLVAGWLLLGIALVLIRLNASAWTTTRVAVAGMPETMDGAAADQGKAFLLGLIYLSSGVLAWFEGKVIFNPVAQAFLTVKRQRDRVSTSITAQEGLVNRNAEDLERARGNLAGLAEARSAVVSGLTALAYELMAESRVRIANHLGDPGATGITENTPAPKEIASA